MHEKKPYLLSIILPFVLGLILTLFLYLTYTDAILKTLNEFEGSWLVITILLARIGLLLLMGVYLFTRWLRQERQYLSDIPFLFAVFFLLVFFGKGYDLLHDLTFHFTDHLSFLFILKLRFIIAVMSIAPMYYLSIGMILFFLSLSDQFKALRRKQVSKRIQNIIFLAVVSTELCVILFWLNVETSGVILPVIVIPSFFTVVLVFYFAHINQRLSQVRPLVLTIAFALYLISQIIRPIFRSLFGNTSLYILVVESIDLLLFFLIFGGLIKSKSDLHYQKI